MKTIILSTTLLTLLVAQSSQATIAGESYCKSQCELVKQYANYETADSHVGDMNVSADALKQLCGNAGDAAAITTCESVIRRNYGMLTGYCDVFLKADVAEAEDLIAAVAYTTAAATCGVGCGCYSGVITGPVCDAAFIYACEIAGGAGISADIIGAYRVNKAGASKDWVAGTMFGVLAEGGQAASHIVAKKGPSGHLTCLATVAFAGTAFVKWQNRHRIRGAAEQACSEMIKLDGGLDPVVGTAKKDSADILGGQNFGADFGKSGNKPNGGMTSHGGGKIKSNPTAQSGGSLTAPNFARELAATAGKTNKTLDNLVKQMPNASQLPDALKAMGSDLGSFSKAVASSGPNGALASLPGLPKGLMKSFEALEKHALETANVEGATMTGAGGGGKKEAAKPNPFGNMFGSKGPGISAGPSEASFEKQKKKDLEPGDDDIYHSNWGGSIFEIVSKRLVKNKENVEQVEWSTPLNRALMGLPNKPGSIKVEAVPDSRGGK